METINPLVLSVARYNTLGFSVLLVTACSSRVHIQTELLQANGQQIKAIHSNKADAPNMDL